MTFCDRCGKELQDHEIYEFDGKELCEDCLNNHTAVCIHCDERIWEEHNAGTTWYCLVSSNLITEIMVLIGI